MNELKERLFDKRFLIEVIVAAVIIRISGLQIFNFSNVSSPQQSIVLSVFVSYLFGVAALISVYFIEKKEIRKILFVPFSILLLLLTVKYAAIWLSSGSYFPYLPNLSNNLVWLYFKAFFNINFIAILIASFQIAKMISVKKDKPFYAFLLINYITIAFYLVLVAPALSRLSRPSIMNIFVYQFVLYISVYFFFAYAPYFVSKGNFLSNFVRSVYFALRHIGITILLSLAVTSVVYVIPFLMRGMQNITNSQKGTVFYYHTLIFLLPLIMYYFFTSFYIIATHIAKRYEQ